MEALKRRHQRLWVYQWQIVEKRNLWPATRQECCLGVCKNSIISHYYLPLVMSVSLSYVFNQPIGRCHFEERLAVATVVHWVLSLVSLLARTPRTFASFTFLFSFLYRGHTALDNHIVSTMNAHYLATRRSLIAQFKAQIFWDPCKLIDVYYSQMAYKRCMFACTCFYYILNIERL